MNVEVTLDRYLESVSSASSTPGGGHVASVVNALACGLMLMSLRIAVLKKEPASVKGRRLEEELLRLQKKSTDLAEEDSSSFREVMKLWKTCGDDLDAALARAADISLEISACAVELLFLIDREELTLYRNIITDVGLSVRLAGASYEGGIMNYFVNSRGLKPEASETLTLKKDRIEARHSELFPRLTDAVRKISGA